MDPVTPYILAGRDRSLLTEGKGVTNTLWSQDVKGKPLTRKKDVVDSGEKWYNLVFQTSNP